MNGFLAENKTKITGAIIVLIGFLQLTDNAAKLQQLLGDNVFAIWNLAAGGLVVVLGFWNTAAAEAKGAAKAQQSGFARVLLISVLAIAAMTAAVTLAGCVNTRAAYQAADSPDEVAFVVAENYAALVKEASAVATAPGAKPEAVRALQAADKRARPLIEQLKPLRDAYLATKSASDGTALQSALTQAVRAVADMLRAVKAAKGAA